MTLFSYEIFDAVARQGSFNKAAQQLHLTPSAISHAIAVMEEELGFALFNRGKNGVSMTSYGASLYPSIRAVLNSDEALKQSIARLNGLEKGKVKLGAFNSVCASLLPGLLKSFAAQYPQIEIEVYQGTYDDVKEWLRTGQVDIAFLSSTCKEEFNLTETLEAGMERYNQFRTRDGYHIDFISPESVTVYTDKSKFLQAFYNIVNNAITYTGADKRVVVRQDVYAAQDGKKWVRVSVTDTGEGIPEDKLALIWDRYYKIDSAHKRAAQGTGLGLSIVNRIMTLLGGKCGVESRVGVGSTFFIEIPAE